MLLPAMMGTSNTEDEDPGTFHDFIMLLSMPTHFDTVSYIRDELIFFRI